MSLGSYRPRDPESTPFYRCLQDYWEEFKESYPFFYEAEHGPWRPVVDKTVDRFLGCGLLRPGLARLKCGRCSHQAQEARGLQRTSHGKRPTYRHLDQLCPAIWSSPIGKRLVFRYRRGPVREPSKGNVGISTRKCAPRILSLPRLLLPTPKGQVELTARWIEHRLRTGNLGSKRMSWGSPRSKQPVRAGPVIGFLHA